MWWIPNRRLTLSFSKSERGHGSYPPELSRPAIPGLGPGGAGGGPLLAAALLWAACPDASDAAHPELLLAHSDTRPRHACAWRLTIFHVLLNIFIFPGVKRN